MAADSSAQRFVLFQSLYDASQAEGSNWEQLIGLLSKGELAAQRAQLDALANQFADGQQLLFDELRDGGLFREWELRFMRLGLAVGKLGNVYLRLAEHYRLQTEFQQRLRRAARLPLILVVGFALLVPLVLFLTGFLPAVAALTSAVLGMLPLLLGAVVLAAINRWNAGREKALNMLYALPGIGGALERYQHYHYINHLGECLAAGFSLPQALKQSARRMPESPIKPRYDKLSRAVDGGESFSSPLLKSGILAGVALSVPESGLEPRQVPASLSLALHRACEDQLQFWASILPYILLGLIPYLVLLNAWFLSR